METPLKPRHFRRWDIPHHAHYYTFSCFRRQPFLARPRPCQWVVDAVARALAIHDWDLWAWVIMPEHVHLLVHPRQRDYSGGHFLKSIKQPVAQKAVAFTKQNAPAFLPRMLDLQPGGRSAHRFWQRGPGYDRNLYGVDEIWEKIGYIHMNPVRRKLVAHPAEWEWSSAQNYLRQREGPLKIDFGTIPRL